MSKTISRIWRANKTTIDANAAATSKRFSELSEYDTKGQIDVHFASGSTQITPEDAAQLNKLARSAVNLTGYLIQVKGFADSSGNAEIEPESEHGARTERNCLFASELQRASSAYCGTRRDG